MVEAAVGALALGPRGHGAAQIGKEEFRARGDRPVGVRLGDGEAAARVERHPADRAECVDDGEFVLEQRRVADIADVLDRLAGAGCADPEVTAETGRADGDAPGVLHLGLDDLRLVGRGRSDEVGLSDTGKTGEAGADALRGLAQIAVVQRRQAA
jgi:hypothetical protein